MIDPTSFTVFLVAALVITVTPGPDMLYILTRGIGQGVWAGLLSALGMSVGMLCHTTAVVLGLATVLRSSSVAYNVLRYAGAAYLLLLAWRSLRDSSRTEIEGLLDGVASARVLGQAILTNLLNPKIVLFYLAFLPQFVHPASGHPAVQLLVLGLIFTALGLVVDSAVALAAGRIGAFLRRSHGAQAWLNRMSGIVFAGLAARIALS